MNQKGFIPILIAVVVIGVILTGVFYSLKRQAQLKQENTPEPFIFTFEECTQSKNSKIVSTFPRQCLSNDGKTYIEKVTEPVDTSNWTAFNEVKGFSFKCPPSWNCRKFNDTSVTIDQQHYSNISTFQFNLITPSNFQKSFLRHPNYNNPISWYNDLLAKKQIAIQAPISTRIYRPGTDGYSDPEYAHYDLSKLENFETINGIKGVIFPASGIYPDTNILIPLSNSELILVLISPQDLYKDPIVKAIVSSVSP